MSSALYATRAQRFFTYLGYYGNAAARQVVRDVEQGTRPDSEKGKRIASGTLSVCIAIIFSPPALLSLFVASKVGKGRFELIAPKMGGGLWKEQSIKVLSLNPCFQDPWAPLTGGVVAPFEPVARGTTRIAAVVNAIAAGDSPMFMGQEFENLAAQDHAISFLQQKGFRYFLRDLGSHDCIRNNSGLFVASKVPLTNIHFVAYPKEDRDLKEILQ